ncbi:MAG: primosomal protein N' [Clostridiales bacterium]|nr:primosomal protein N' [Clostridiales bacterium]
MTDSRLEERIDSLSRKTVRVCVDSITLSADRLYEYLVTEEISGQNGKGMKLCPGMRVAVPFGRGNVIREAIVISLQDGQPTGERKLKFIQNVLDTEPLLDEESLRLAAHLRRRLHCPFYTIVRAMLPAGVWYRLQVKYRLSEKPVNLGAEISIEELALLEVLKNVREPMLLREIEELVPSIQEKTLRKLTADGILECIAESDTTVKDKTSKLILPTEKAEECFEEGICTLRSAPQRKVLEFLRSAGASSAKEIMYYTGVSESPIRTLLKGKYLRQEQIEVFRRPEFVRTDRKAITLNETQNIAFKGLKELADQKHNNTALLYGVTGSGKTPVYMKLIEHVLSTGKNVIMLVPEISLTPQLMKQFFAYFGDCVAVMHSALSVGERYDEYKRIKSGVVRVVIGTRSAVFAPIKNVGLIVIDEEHEHTFRSEEPPRYHARDVARYICFRSSALLLLGSATPSIESMYAAKKGNIKLFTLPERYGEATLPQVVVSDMRKAMRERACGVFSPELIERIKNLRREDNQAVLMLNRRGSSRSIRCMECCYVPQCIRCSVSMAHHGENGRLICHQCGYSEIMIDKCPQCGGTHFEQLGIGTQQAERELSEHIPDIRIIRMDSDSTMRKDSHSKLLESFGRGEADVLIGTQMIAKGLDFRNVTLSAVLDADMMLTSPDYRGTERAFSLMMQSAGRAGRREKPGIALIQTMTPENDVIKAVQNQDYMEFYRCEIEQRRALRLPPFYDMWRIMLSGRVMQDVKDEAKKLKRILSKALEGHEVDIMGPAPAEIFKLSDRFRFVITMRLKDGASCRNIVGGVLENTETRKVTIGIDTYY